MLAERLERMFNSTAMAIRSDVTTKLRLASGLTLMAFVASHLVNHALGIHSLATMERGRDVFVAIWRSWPGTVLLYAALFAHILLVVHKLYRRRSLRMPAWEAAQIGLGLLIPFWLTVHVVGTRGLHTLYGVEDNYAYELDLLWPGGVRQQSTLVLIAWLHGCTGVHFWLRLRPWYARVRSGLFAVALLLPTFALIGFVDGARDLAARAAADPAWLRALAKAGNWPDAAEMAWVYRTEDVILAVVVGVLLLVIGARVARVLHARSLGRVRLRYPNGTVIGIARGMSVLEASRSAGIPHASVCGGRGRCSTCRVRVGEGVQHLAPPAPDEAKVLVRIAADANVRLACQLRPTHDLAIAPLLPATTGPRDVRIPVNPGQGVEREIAVLFADLRAFTRMAEGRLPYDVVFVLNQYFKAMGRAIEEQGGRVDKFIGDGIMALFGVEERPGEACRQALAGARAMALALDDLNRHLEGELNEPLRIGIGLHVGPVILGEMGYRAATSLTAIGDAVNVASRLEALTKELNVQLAVSARLAERAGVDLSSLEVREIEIRGRRRPLRVRLAPDARRLPVPAAVERAPGRPVRAWWTMLLPGRRTLDARSPSSSSS
ncbi:MAG: adenylate/guanylate cyclase domain-containing protein [Geminicoccaceae bacterium]